MSDDRAVQVKAGTVNLKLTLNAKLLKKPFRDAVRALKTCADTLASQAKKLEDAEQKRGSAKRHERLS